MGATLPQQVAEEQQRVRRVVGEQIREHLNALGKTVTWLSEQTGIARPDLSDMIGGHRIANAHHVTRIAKALLCSPNELIPPQLVGLTMWGPQFATEVPASERSSGSLNRMSGVRSSVSIPSNLERYLERHPNVSWEVVTHAAASLQRDANPDRERSDAEWDELIKDTAEELAGVSTRPGVARRKKGTRAPRKS